MKRKLPEEESLQRPLETDEPIHHNTDIDGRKESSYSDRNIAYCKFLVRDRELAEILAKFLMMLVRHGCALRKWHKSILDVTQKKLGNDSVDSL